MPINTITTKTNIANNAAQPKKAEDQGKVSIVDKNTTNSQNQSGKVSLTPDSVNLTGSAMRIKALEEQIARLPIVDTQKIEQIKNSINDGSFEFNPERIAKKMIDFEKELQ